MDISNNRRDNLTSFHDVMKSFRWEIRCLAFFFAVAEANAFSAYKAYAYDGKETLHTKFRWRLAQSLLSKAESMRSPADDSLSSCPPSRQQRNVLAHGRVSLGLQKSGYVRKRHCRFENCKKKSSQRCVCDTNNVFCKEHMDAHFNASR